MLLVIVAIVIYSNGSSARLKRLEVELYGSTEDTYADIRSKFLEQIRHSQDSKVFHIYSKKEQTKHLKQLHQDLKEFETSRMNVIAIISSPDYNIDSKERVASLWRHYLWKEQMFHWRVEAIGSSTDEIGVAASEVNNARQALMGALAAFHFR